jgi:hypothetical protein
MARSRDISKVLSSNSTLATDAEVAATYQTQAGTGLRKIVPSSVAVGSGTGSADSLGNVTFSGCSSVSLNDVFSTTYRNYRIIIDLTAATADANIYMKMRVSSTDSSAGYYAGSPTYTVAGTAGNSSANNSTTGFYLTEIDSATAANHTSGANIDLMRPFETVYTTIQWQSQGAFSAGTVFAQYGGGLHAVSTSYTGFSLIPNAGNISGTISVYGYTQ